MTTLKAETKDLFEKCQHFKNHPASLLTITKGAQAIQIGFKVVKYENFQGYAIFLVFDSKH